MIDVRSLTLEQSRKLQSYYDFYSQELLETFGKTNVEKLEEVKNKPYYRSYLNIVRRTAELVSSMQLENPICACVVFEYLLWNGYMSRNHSLVFCGSDRINNMAVTGADIMRGKSVCLNNADMLKDILRELGIKAYTFGCDLRTISASDKLIYKPDITRTTEKSKFRDRLFTSFIDLTPAKKMGNHAITLFEYNDFYMLNDPTNLGFLSFVDFLKAKYIGSNLTVDIKPWLPIVIDSMSKDELDNLVFRSFILSDYRPISVERLKDFSEEAMEKLSESKDILELFYENNKKDIDIVCKTLTKK